jgi:ABC-type multidrug transport system ATPase subunit
VLRGVDLDLPAGCLVEVTGRNGAGKSSLLRVLAGVLALGEGRVRDRPAVIGWAPERFPSAQPFTARAYLHAQARVRGLSEPGARTAVEREAARLHLTPLLGTPLSELSKGSAQKVGIAQALLVPPGLLVLDEPWSGLDAGARAAVPVLVREVRAGGGRVVVTDHQQHAAALAPTARWHLEDGQARPAATERPPTVVVEVEVPVSEAAGLLGELSARGLSPRVR